MSKQLFRIGAGIDDGLKYYLSGVNAPGTEGNAGLVYEDAAPVGSQYQNTTTGALYIKTQSGGGATKWSAIATQASLESLVTGISWREPVAVTDATSTTTSAVIDDLNADNQIQGVTVNAGDRLLLANLTTGANVYIVGGAPGAWTLTQDVNSTTAGDSVQTLGGTNLGKMYTFYNDTGWSWSASLSTSEDNFLRQFIGKGAAGSELPAYSSQNYIVNDDNLETAIGKLDTQVKTNSDALGSLQTSAGNIQTEVDALETSLGSIVNASGVYQAFSGTNYIDGNATLTSDLTDLDAAIKANADAISLETTNRGTADTNLQNELDATQTGAGLATDGTYVVPTTSNYLNSSTSLADADAKLDAQIKTVADLVGSNNTAIQTEVDNLETATGMAADGTFSAYTSTNYINAATSMKNADVLLDTQAKANADAISTETTNRTNADTAIQNELDATQTGAGLGTGGAYTADSGSTYLTAATSLYDADSKLDAAIDDVNTNVTALETSLGSIVGADGTWVGLTGTNYLNAATTVTGMFSALDTQLKSTTDAATTEIDTFEATVGVNTDGSLAAWGGTNTYVTGTTTFKAGIDALDVQLKTVTDGLATEITNRTNADTTIQGYLDSLESATGMNTDGTFSAYTSTNYIDTATSMKNADVLLDTELKAANDRVGDLQYSSTHLVALSDTVTVAIGKLDAALSSSVSAVTADGITTSTAVDSVPVDNYSVSKWIVTVTSVADETKKETAVVMGVHNGTSGLDATTADYTIFGQLRTNGEIEGLAYTVELNGTGIDQVLQLKVAATGAVNVRATRLRVAI
jgi:hypothetical protein